MYHHVKKLMYTVRVDDADPRFGNMLLEQFGGANGELAAAMQYFIQGLNCDDAERKDLLMDIGTEVLSHLEIVGVLARLHLKPMKFDSRACGGFHHRCAVVGRRRVATPAGHDSRSHGRAHSRWHELSEAGAALGGRGAAVLRRARQDRQVPDGGDGGRAASRGSTLCLLVYTQPR